MSAAAEWGRLAAGSLILLAAILGLGLPWMLWMERRLEGGRGGAFLQPLLDGAKLLCKERALPARVKGAYRAAPLLALVPALMLFAVVPFGAPLGLGGRVLHLQLAELNAGLLYVAALAALSAGGMALGGWSSNSPQAWLGAGRAAGVVVAYHLALGLALVGVALSSGSLRLGDIVAAQAAMLGPLPRWNAVLQPIGFCVALAALALAGQRRPFDTARAPELEGGYRAQYSGGALALFVAAEGVFHLAAAALITALYCGGGHIPYLSRSGAESQWMDWAEPGAFALKTALVLAFFTWVRASLPRLRLEQMLRFGWKVLLPLAGLNIVLSALLVMF